jgi:hypothetical protein
MPHVTFVHGIANKPKAEKLLEIWLGAMENSANALSLDAEGVTTSMVYWADLMYDKPIEDTSDFESAAANADATADSAGDVAPPVPSGGEEAKFLEGVRGELTAASGADLASDAPPPAPDPAAQGTFERIPLPWFIKRRIMSAFLRDVHHYLFDVQFAPPGRPKVPIQKTIRRVFLDRLKAAPASGKHIVVSHSMGTVIAYDCLKRVDECAKVDGFITLGCPLGIDEVQDKLKPGWTRDNGYPFERVATRWVNIYDSLDPVCGLDPKFSNDFMFSGAARVEDIKIENDGAWRHSATKYLRQPKFTDTLRDMLGV